MEITLCRDIINSGIAKKKKKKKYTAVNNDKTLTDVNLGECSEFSFQCQHNPRHRIYKKKKWKWTFQIVAQNNWTNIFNISRHLITKGVWCLLSVLTHVVLCRRRHLHPLHHLHVASWGAAFWEIIRPCCRGRSIVAFYNFELHRK